MLALKLAQFGHLIQGNGVIGVLIQRLAKPDFGLRWIITATSAQAKSCIGIRSRSAGIGLVIGNFLELALTFSGPDRFARAQQPSVIQPGQRVIRLKSDGLLEVGFGWPVLA